MKFSWKMILLTTILLALSLSIGGYSMIRNSFRQQLAAEIDAAQEGMKSFSVMLKTISSSYNEGQADLKKVVQLIRGSSLQNYYDFSLWDENGSFLFSTDKMKSDTLQRPTNNYVSQSRIMEESYILTTVGLELCGQMCYIQRERDVGHVYEQMQENLNQYQWSMLAIMVAGIAMTMLFTIVLTRPLRRISRTAKQLSAGHYDKRIHVRSKDELGQVANDFNDMADALEQKIAQLADALQRQKDFTASFAHELKTPLTSVIGYADTLRSRELHPEKRFEAADYIVSEGKRLESMSFALLDLFALEREQPQLRLYSVTKLFEQIKKSCEYLLKEKKINLELQIEEASFFMVPELMQTLLYNLIDNARKASKEAGAIRVVGRKTKNAYVLCVSDEGCGIPQEVLQRITEPFYMVDKSRARADGGAGLGLALCEKIARLHGTQLCFKSELGRGTQVSLTFEGVRA